MSEGLINRIIMTSVFGLVLSVWCICVVLWVVQYAIRLRRMRQRLGIAGETIAESQSLRLWRQFSKDAGKARVHKKSLVREYLGKLRHQAGWRAPALSIFLRLLAAAAAVFAATYLLGGGVLLGLGVSAGVTVGFWIYTQNRILKRTTLFEKQLLDALGIAARALRAGHPLVGAFQLVSEEIAEPQGPVFAQICQEQSLGLDMKDSIRKVADTTYNTELKLFATAVAIQLSSGGNLADLMDCLASVVRARMKLNRRVRVLTAQTQLSKRILIALPVLLFIVLSLISPEYMATFYTTSDGRMLLAATVGTVCLGTWVMSRISVLRY
jgi:tight adherence protein B